MKIAVVGTRGIPATFGGIEKHCEELYSKLVEMGYDVTIYGRKGYTDNSLKEFKGIKLKTLWTFKSKHLEASFHTFYSLLCAMCSDADVIHFHAQGPCMFAWMPRLFTPKKKLVFTCHGLDWKRNKWSKIAQSFIKFGEILSAKLFDHQIMVSQSLENYYKKTYEINPVTIKNGTTIPEIKNNSTEKSILQRFNLKTSDYFLFVGRLVPEKAPHRLINEFKKLKTDKKLVITGGSAATDSYVLTLKNLAKDDDRIIFTSSLYGKELADLYSNALAYVSASELEGLPLTLLEAMSYKLPCLVSNIPPHVEVIGKNQEYGLVFDLNNNESLLQAMQKLLLMKESQLQKLGFKASELIKLKYNWHNAAAKVEKIYKLSNF